jgi:hypothetical protein
VEALREMCERDPRIVLHVQPRDWSSKRSAVFDGQQKALARAICTGEICWQQDSDEIVHEGDYQKVRDMVAAFPPGVELVALPVVEFWGSTRKVRIDVNPWKWRISRNLPHITHGIPASLRRFDGDGRLFSGMGSDGCDYVRADSFQPVPCANFMTNEAESVRVAALSGYEDSRQQFEVWFNKMLSVLPAVRHYSWWNIERKIKSYRGFWQRHWESLYDVRQEDTVENNMFFDKPWSEVTDDQISSLASDLQERTGGWVFHRKIDLTRPTPSIVVESDHPVVILDWIRGAK